MLFVMLKALIPAIHMGIETRRVEKLAVTSVVGWSFRYLSGGRGA